MGCKISRYEFCRRMIVKEFKSQPSGTMYPYVLTDIVAQGKYRIVYKASGLVEDPQNEAAEGNMVALWLIPNTTQLPKNVTTYDTFFVDLFGGATPGNNRPPTMVGLRVDELQGSNGLNTLSENGIEVPLVCVVPLMVPEGFCLMGYHPPRQGDVFGTTPGPNVRLRMAYVDLLNTEELAFDM